MLKAYLLIFTLMIVSACGSKKKDESSDSSARVSQNFFIKGDLKNFYEGMLLNKESVIPADQVENFNEFNLLKFSVMSSTGVRIPQKTIEKEETSQENEKSRQQGQEASRENVRNESQMVFSFDKKTIKGVDQWLYSDRDENIQLLFEKASNKLVLKSYFYKALNGKKKEVKVKAIHYSISQNGLNFSILARADEKQGSALIQFQFSYSDQPSIVKEASQDYTFLLGPTKKAVIAPGSTISLCSKVPTWIKHQVKRAFDSWNALLPEGHLKYEVAQEYPPFSDINFKCIYFIRDFDYTDPELKNISLGFASTGIHFAKGEIVDSDMIIPVNAWKQIFEAREWGSFENPSSEKKREIEAFVYGVISHEIGHMLGLDHSFTQHDKTDSIMDYSADRHFTQYDKDSIEELYKEFY